MRALVQRVSSASVEVAGEVVGAIDRGLLVLLGVTHDDTPEIAERLAEKAASLRIFNDDQGKFNLSLRDVHGAVLVVSQFTLYADTRKGQRPSFLQAAQPSAARVLVDHFATALRRRDLPVASGVFGAHMRVSLINDGPVTLMLDSEDWLRPRRGGPPRE
jgi:D-aminoacyl-tRNA deacylase